MEISKTLRYTKENINLKIWTPARWLVTAGILGMAVGSANIIYCVNEIENKVNSKYPPSSPTNNNQQKIDYKYQLEHETPVPGGIIFVSGFGLILSGAFVDKRKEDKKEKAALAGEPLL